MRNAHFKDMSEIQDVESHNMYKLFGKFGPLKKKFRRILFDVSRDNARTPMCWDNSEYAGFSKVEPWIRVNADKDTINAKIAVEDPNSLYHFYQELIKFRDNNEVIRNGEFVLRYKNSNKLFIYERKLNDKKIVVVCSFSHKNQKLKCLEKLLNYRVVLSNYQNHLTNKLQPFECLLVES